MKLDTAALILEWAKWHESAEGQLCSNDTATAERLAYCVRVTEIVEAKAHAEDSLCSDFYDNRNILAEAAQ